MWPFNKTDCASIFTDRWTWVPRWLTAQRDKPHPPSRPTSRSRQVRDRPPPHRLPRPISRLDRDRLAPGSSGSATRHSRWSWCRWTRMVCCPLPATDWMLHYIRAVCVSCCWAAVCWSQKTTKHHCFHSALLPSICWVIWRIELRTNVVNLLNDFFPQCWWWLCYSKYTCVESNTSVISGLYNGVQAICVLFLCVCAGPGANPAAAGQQMPGQPGTSQWKVFGILHFT